MERKLHIVIGCDTDPDRSDFLDNLPENSLGWRGMLEGIPRMKERLKNLHDAAGKEPALTWCLRVDYQVRQIHGSYSYILDEYKNFLLDLERSGDELAWHPHFWNYDGRANIWYPECFDVGWQITMLEEAHAAYQTALPNRARTVRMGWGYHNNQTFATLQRLGVKVDFSAIPGMKIDPKNKRPRSINFFLTGTIRQIVPTRPACRTIGKRPERATNRLPSRRHRILSLSRGSGAQFRDWPWPRR